MWIVVQCLTDFYGYPVYRDSSTHDTEEKAIAEAADLESSGFCDRAEIKWVPDNENTSNF